VTTDVIVSYRLRKLLWKLMVINRLVIPPNLKLGWIETSYDPIFLDYDYE
jgi:hypothetical protein